MDARELGRVEPLLDFVHGKADEMRGAAGVKAHVLPLGLDPVDVRRGDEQQPSVRLGDEAIPVALLALRVEVRVLDALPHAPRRSFLITSKPSLPGIWMSRKTRSGTCLRISAAASVPFTHSA